jgi:DNA-binding IclR family transcriptional regulator
MDLLWPLTTLCPHTEYRLLSVLAVAEAPLGGNELSRRAGMAQGGGRGALDRLVAVGLVAARGRRRT